MKKLLYAFALTIGAAFSAQAAPGDTTRVQATNRRFDRGNGYGAYDTAVTFPAGNVSYRKIYMVFTLGKYACPGYNPSNPGEGSGQTGWCGDWDYTVMNYLMTPGGDTVELGRFITPYANSNWPRTPLGWKQNYVYDVTDYYPLLKNNATFRVFYSGYSAGFTGNVEFLFIEGTPERNVLRIDRLWDGGYDYGRATSINTALKTISNTAPAGTQASVVKLNVTGHGGDNKGCAEFCPNTFNLGLNGNTIATQQLFRANCSENELYPQSGTWIYARANWCPGALVNTYSYPLQGITGGSAYQLGLSFPAYTTVGGNPASYIISGVVMNYGATNKTLDAGIEDIIAPTDNMNHFRQNPTATRPIITIRNSGSTAITSVQIEYGVEGRMANTYTWTGNLASFESRDINLPPLNQLMLSGGTYGFYSRIVQVNGQQDVDVNNNLLRSKFTAAPVWPEDLSIQLITNSDVASGTSSETSWKILDAMGNVVAQKLDCGARAYCESIVHLKPGAYTFAVADSAFGGYNDIPSGRAVGYFTGTGLTSSFSTDRSSGSISVYDTLTGSRLNLDGYFSGNFGGGFKQSFYVGAPLSIGKTKVPGISLSAVPNPASNSFVVKAEGSGNREGIVRVIDVTGREVLRQPYRYGFEQISSANLQSGIYLIDYEGKDGSTARQRIVISH
jgi:hypothetical protein